MGRYAAATALLLLLPLVFLVAYVSLVGAPAAAIAPHLVVVATLAIGLGGARLVVSALPISSDMRRFLSACLICGALALLVCLYALSLAGVVFWGRVGTYNMARTYVAQAPDLLRTLGFSPALVFCMLAMLVVAVVSAVYFYLLRYDWIPVARSFRTKGLAAACGLSLLSLCIFGTQRLEAQQWGREGEPLSLSLFPWQGERDAQSHRVNVFHVKHLQSLDERARAAYRPSSAAKRSNVILIVGDALRSDHLSLYGYARKNTPNLRAFRDKGAMPLATTVLAACNESACGLQALASSRTVDQQSPAPLTLHEVLKKHGYRSHLVFSGDHANFYGLDRIYGPVDSYFDGASQKARYVNDDRLVLDRLAALGPWDGVPTLLHVHLMSTHALGRRFDETPSFGPEANYNGNRRGASDDELRQMAVNQYDRGVLQFDAMTDRLLAQLEAGGYLKDAIVVITGDHGESLGERGRYSHAHSVWEEALRVPFIVLAYGKADPGALQGGPALSQIDIAPTVLHMLGMPQPSNWQGRPVQKPIERRYIHFQQAAQIGLVDTRQPDGLYKHWVDARAGRAYTFNLTKDPQERNDITAEVPMALRIEWRDELLRHAGALAREHRDTLRAMHVNH